MRRLQRPRLPPHNALHGTAHLGDDRNSMFQVLIRIIAVVVLALAVVLAILDITRSITASGLVLTGATQTLETLSPGSIATMAETVSSTLHPVVWDPVLLRLLSLPSFLLCFAVAMLLFWSAARRSRPLGRFSSR